jgi:hypothetical protein
LIEVPREHDIAIPRARDRALTISPASRRSAATDRRRAGTTSTCALDAQRRAARIAHPHGDRK